MACTYVCHVGFQEENDRREQEAKALEEKRLQVLQRLAASVPYAEACANAEAKLDHVTGEITDADGLRLRRMIEMAGIVIMTDD